MNFLDAAYEVLKQAGEPLSISQLTNRALKLGLIDTKGQTPEASMGSRLYVDTKRPDSRFQRTGRNVFALAEPEEDDIVNQIAAINRQTRAELHKRLLALPPAQFEQLIESLLRALGFVATQVTSSGGDGGVDVRGVLNAGGVTEVNAAVQVKRWKQNVQAPTVQSLRGSLVIHEQGIIVTTGGFSKGAEEEARAVGKARISLIDGEALLELLTENQIGVTAKQHLIHSLDENWLGVEDERPVPHPTIQPRLPPKVSFPIAIEANAHNQTFQAQLLDEKGRVSCAGREYRSPSAAGAAVTGWKACNGWSLWRYFDDLTGTWRLIDELRGE